MPKTTSSEEARMKIMAYVASFCDTHGYAPSYREIGAAVGLKSPATVYKHIKRLEVEGKLDMKAKKSRVVSAHRQITIADTEQENIRRGRLDIADGGSVYFDCCVSGADGRDVTFSFSGIFDASQLKGGIGQVVACRFEN